MASRTALFRIPALACALALACPASVALAATADGGTAHGGRAQTQPRADIVDTAVRAGQFKTLAAALNAAGLVETLKGPGPFTVFAPTDAAFAALPPGTLEELLKPENRRKLVAILTYHVVPGRVSASQAAKLDSATTVQGGALAIRARDGAVTVDGARVVAADVAASNGVIHVIDKVLLPEG